MKMYLSLKCLNCDQCSRDTRVATIIQKVTILIYIKMHMQKMNAAFVEW
jgi:hypothetical protein